MHVEHGDNRSADKWYECSLQPVGSGLVINPLAVDIEGEGLNVFGFLGRIFDRGLGPGVEGIVFHIVGFSFSHIACKGIMLAFEFSLLPLQY